jgi:hypothetical protein
MYRYKSSGRFKLFRLLPRRRGQGKQMSVDDRNFERQASVKTAAQMSAGRMLNLAAIGIAFAGILIFGLSIFR